MQKLVSSVCLLVLMLLGGCGGGNDAAAPATSAAAAVGEEAPDAGGTDCSFVEVIQGPDGKVKPLSDAETDAATAAAPQEIREDVGITLKAFHESRAEADSEIWAPAFGRVREYVNTHCPEDVGKVFQPDGS